MLFVSPSSRDRLVFTEGDGAIEFQLVVLGDAPIADQEVPAFNGSSAVRWPLVPVFGSGMDMFGVGGAG